MIQISETIELTEEELTDMLKFMKEYNLTIHDFIEIAVKFIIKTECK